MRYNTATMVEHGTKPQSLVDSAHGFLTVQRLEEERRKLAEQFVGRANELLWNFGPVKYREYDRNYTYAYRKPGIGRTPAVPLRTPTKR